MDPAVWFQEDMIMDCKLRAKNCGGCPMLATEYAAQLKKKEDIRWQVSEKLQRSQEFHLLLYRE